MANHFGGHYSRKQLSRYVGDIAQIAGVRVGELGDGFERGIRTG